MTRAWGWAVAGAALVLGTAGCSMFRRDVEILVRDPAGKPVEGATLSCYAPSLNAPDVQTDKRGKADVPRLVQRVDTCRVRKAGYQARLPFQVPRDAGRIQVTLRRLEPGERELTIEELLQQQLQPAEP